MRFLLDTHVALWAVAGSSKLPRHVAARLQDRAHPVFVSLVSLWEVAIKHSIIRPNGRRRLDANPDDLLRWMEATDIDLLALNADHCRQVDALPYRINPRTGQPHADPFDRMLVAQALAEPMRLLTADQSLALHIEDAPGLIEMI